MEKILRVVSSKGKYAFKYVMVDGDGDVIKVLRDDLEVTFRDLSEMHELTDEMKAAMGLPVFHVGAINKRMLGLEEE